MIGALAGCRNTVSSSLGEMNVASGTTLTSTGGNGGAYEGDPPGTTAGSVWRLLSPSYGCAANGAAGAQSGYIRALRVVNFPSVEVIADSCLDPVPQAPALLLEQTLFSGVSSYGEAIVEYAGSTNEDPPPAYEYESLCRHASEGTGDLPVDVLIRAGPAGSGLEAKIQVAALKYVDWFPVTRRASGDSIVYSAGGFQLTVPPASPVTDGTIRAEIDGAPLNLGASCLQVR